MPAQQDVRSFKQAPRAKSRKSDEAKLFQGAGAITLRAVTEKIAVAGLIRMRGVPFLPRNESFRMRNELFRMPNEVLSVRSEMFRMPNELMSVRDESFRMRAESLPVRDELFGKRNALLAVRNELMSARGLAAGAGGLRLLRMRYKSILLFGAPLAKLKEQDEG